MASNLAVQYAAGISVPGCQHFGRYLVNQAHKTTIMGMAAINPAAAMQCEASSVLVSTPRHLHGNSAVSTKKNKTMVVAYPSLEFTPGIPVRTEGKLENHSFEDLKLDGKIFRAGSRSVKLNKEIKAGDTSSFTQEADSRCSIGALEHAFPGDKFKWIISWSNDKDDLNKVYTQILRDEADWNEIRENLDKSGQESIFDGTNHGIPYSSKVMIDKTSTTPTMTATLQRGGIGHTLAANISADNTLPIGNVGDTSASSNAGDTSKAGNNLATSTA